MYNIIIIKFNQSKNLTRPFFVFADIGAPFSSSKSTT
jgi:hypothetical protein